MYPLDPEDIHRKIPCSEYHVSLKLDGEFTVLVYQNGSLFTINPGGTVRVGMPWQEDALKCLKNAGIKQAMIAGELYAANDQNRRERVHDVTSLARQPKNKDDLSRLRFAVFDCVSVNGCR